MKFVALDVETANANMRSICQIGIATFENSKLTKRWKSYVHPEDYFDPMNVSIHGITDSHVKDAPTFENLYSELQQLLLNQTVVTHSTFDRTAMLRAAAHIHQPMFECSWLDTTRVARRTWNEVAYSGYNLKNVCKLIKHEFEHHDALEDAIACGQILLSAHEKTGLDLDAWRQRIKQGIDPSACLPIKVDGNPSGPLYGEVLVFTGALALPRKEAAEYASKLGISVAPSVTKRTTILCVGDQDISKLAGHTKSSKHRKTEMLISKGQAIRIIGETDFFELKDI